MVRASAKTSTLATSVPAPVNVIDNVPVSVPGESAAPKVTKKTATKKASTKSEDVPVAQVAVSEPVVSENVVENPLSGDEALLDKSTLSGALLAEIADFNKNFQVWVNSGNALKSNVKNIAKISSRVSKNADKSSKKKKNAKSRPSGFEKPTLISDELALFFGKDLGSLMARTDVSKHIHDYVMQHKLQNEKNRRIIHPDAKLKKLLNVNNDELTYFNLQKYLKFHFKKEATAATVASA
jgi:chromatin remodeling complex protein RSC6